MSPQLHRKNLRVAKFCESMVAELCVLNEDPRRVNPCNPVSDNE